MFEPGVPLVMLMMEVDVIIVVSARESREEDCTSVFVLGVPFLVL